MSGVTERPAPSGGAGGESTAARQLTLESLVDQNAYACYQCAKCTASCPYGLAPHRVMRLVQMGALEEAQRLDTPEACAGCSTCVRVCPKGLRPMPVNHAVARSGGGGKKRALRSRIFAHINRLSRAGSRTAPVSNWLLRAPGARLVNHHLLGIHKARTLPPPYARIDFPTWFEDHAGRNPNGSASEAEAPPVLFFHDTFTDYHFPEIGKAVTRVVEGAGRSVHLADNVCCGRPMISKGFEEEAMELARENVQRLHGPASQGRWIVGCEPTCLLALRDDYPDLLPPGEMREKARVVAERSLLVDEFVEDLLDGEGLRPPSDGPERLLFHAHCHHKTYGSPLASRRLLERAGYQVLTVSANCCGMAGSYGAERENFERSLKAFDDGVGIALRNHPDLPLAITGASCRMQVGDLSERTSRHVVEWVADALPAEEGVTEREASTQA